jgi:hypothetical protein
MELPPKLFYHSFELCGHLFHKYFVNSLINTPAGVFLFV